MREPTRSSRPVPRAEGGEGMGREGRIEEDEAASETVHTGAGVFKRET